MSSASAGAAGGMEGGYEYPGGSCRPRLGFCFITKKRKKKAPNDNMGKTATFQVDR